MRQRWKTQRRGVASLLPEPVENEARLSGVTKPGRSPAVDRGEWCPIPAFETITGGKFLYTGRLRHVWQSPWINHRWRNSTCVETASLRIGFGSDRNRDAGRGPTRLRVRDIPVPEGATDVSYMKRRGDVRFQVASDFKTAGNFYAKKLAEQKWTKSGKDNLQRNFWVQKFAKGKLSLEVRVDSRGDGQRGSAHAEGTDVGRRRSTHPKDLPLPKDATDIEYDDFFESIEFKSPSNVKTTLRIADQRTRRAKVDEGRHRVRPGDLCPDEIHARASRRSTIDIRAEDTGSEVAIRTKGMQWDGMKAEIERAEKEAKKVADRHHRRNKKTAENRGRTAEAQGQAQTRNRQIAEAPQ